MLLISYSIAGQPAGRSVQNFNSGWKFFKGDVPEGQKTDLDVSQWRLIDLHMTGVLKVRSEKTITAVQPTSPGVSDGTGRHFIVPENESGRKVFIYFEGIYNNSEVWINGNYLGKRPNGYISFQYDLTPFINFGGVNLIAVRVDHSLYGDSRWYTGSGFTGMSG